jgi:hypothetical protein
MTSDAERKAMNEANRLFSNVFAKVLAQSLQFDQGPEGPEHGEHRRNRFRYFESPDHRMFCWTPWKDSNGDYWTWVFKPVGRGAKTKPRQWKRVGKRVRSRTRKTAKKRAHTRYMNWLKYLRNRYLPVDERE